MRTSRTSAWLGDRWWSLVAFAMAVCVAGLVVTMLLGPGGPVLTTWVDDLAETAAALIGGVACVVAAARHRGRYRLAWSLMGASAFAWGFGQIAWDWYELLENIQAPFPSAADAGYLAAVPLAVGGVLSFPVAFDRARSVAHTLLDGMVIAAALLVVSWETVLGSVYRAGADGPLAMILGIAYPLSDVAIVTMILVRLGRSPRRGRVALLLLAAGLVTMAIADSSFAYLTASGTFNSGNVLDTGWVAGYLLIGLAALHSASHPVRQAPPRTIGTRLHRFLPYPPVAAALGVMIAERIGSNQVDLFTFWTMLALVMLVLVRQYLALGANAALVGNLAAREREMAYQAHHDALTGLPNRVSFQEAVGRALSDGDDEQECAVLFIDLDDFKQINDTYGHATGDSVLRLVAGRLKANLRPEDTAARLGGDEFAVLVEDARAGAKVSAIAERILTTLRQPAAMDGRMLPVRGTIGIAVADRTVDGEELLRRADVAMYTAKRQGKDRCSVFAGDGLQVLPPLEPRDVSPLSALGTPAS